LYGMANKEIINVAVFILLSWTENSLAASFVV
jgi:hypothetical protein